MLERFTALATAAWILAGATAPASAEASSSVVLVVCSPGSPGTTDDAQPVMDALASAISAKAGVTVTASYTASDAEGVAHLKTAGVGMVSLPFFLVHEKELALKPRLDVVQRGRPDLETWVLVAAKGKVATADALANYTIVSNVAFARGFVEGNVIGKLGRLPASAKLQQSQSVLSALRKAANGEAIAVVLDGAQAESLKSLGYAAKLEVVAKSAAMPAGVIVTVGDRVPDATWRKLDAALRALPKDALEAAHLDRFADLNTGALDAARKAFAVEAK